MTLPGVYTFLDVSTAHITKKDDELIQKDDVPLGCYPYDQGYFIYAGERQLLHLRGRPAGIDQGGSRFDADPKFQIDSHMHGTPR